MLCINIQRGGYTADAIWNSWADCFERYPDGTTDVTTMGQGVKALTWKLLPSIRQNILWSYASTTVWGNMANAFLIPFIYLGSFFLVSRLNTVDLGLYPLKSVDRPRLSNILLFQAVVSIAFMTLFSCDYGRVIPYWTLSSLMVYSCLEDFQLFEAAHLSAVSRSLENAQRWIDGCRFLHSPYFYLAVLCALPITSWYSPTVGALWQMDLLNSFLSHVF